MTSHSIGLLVLHFFINRPAARALVVSNDDGNLWKMLLHGNEPVQILDGDFGTDRSFIVLARDSNFNYVIKFKDRLDTLTVSKSSRKGTVVGKKVYSLMEVGSLGLNTDYSVYDIETGKTSKVHFDGGHYVDSYSKHDESFYLAANTNRSSCIVKLGVNGYEKIPLGKIPSIR